MGGLDLQISGRVALVCGSSNGLGKACATALAKAGVHVTINGRDEQRLDAARLEIEGATGARIDAVVGDVTIADGRGRVLDVCTEPDILINNAAGPPPGNFEDWGEEEWATAVGANMISPIQMIRATVPAMKRRRWGRVINITSGAVKAPLPLLGLSNGARSGLTGFVAGIARELAPFGITVNNLLPGNFATDRLRSYAAALAKRDSVTFEDAWQRLEQANPTRRLGKPDEFGTVCAFLASEHAAYINGQNLLLDGGAYPGVF
jgi:3-oxoacyl-[acyl-carrier protein] reductase